MWDKATRDERRKSLDTGNFPPRHLEVQKVTGVTSTGTDGGAIYLTRQNSQRNDFGDVPLDENSIPCFAPTQIFAMKANVTYDALLFLMKQLRGRFSNTV